MDSSDSGEEPVRPRSAGRSIAKAALIISLPILVIVVPIVLIVGLIAIVFAGLPSLFAPGEWAGFSVTDATCVSEPDSNRSLLEIEVTATEGVDFFRIEPLDTSAALLTGVASLGDREVGMLDDLGRLELKTQLEDSDSFADLTAEPTYVVLELTRARATDDVLLSELTLWWSTGEPAFVQHVPLALEWSEDECRVTLG